ncbi:hypothetical protein CBR_g49830 [Chara braunii]|uniref:Retrotransposon gag domain-containing protein n=1 Tax=Chara braunii TaxID=69332 RepID=A0A388JP27_CHABU|nr:hypothetical protein CBR_g49830 [Chara braunii]|eukprot:GBG59570.1 hypothetical protein CBR_g49830 [Chara braunii]
MLSAHACTVTELHKYIAWADLTAAWKKRFQVELPKHQAMDKLLTFSQNSMPSGDWISEFQRLASTPKLPMNFDGIKLYFIRRLCPALQNALTQVAENLNTSEELFNKAAQIIVTNLAARNTGHSSTAGQGAHQHRSKVAVVAAATPSDPSILNEAVSFDKGDRLAAAQNGGAPPKDEDAARRRRTPLLLLGPGKQLKSKDLGQRTGLRSAGTASAPSTAIVCGATAQHMRQRAVPRRPRVPPNRESKHRRECCDDILDAYGTGCRTGNLPRFRGTCGRRKSSHSSFL